jgi:hypothetical protein
MTDGLVCEFGASPVVACDVVDTCKGGRWHESAPDLTDPACAPAPSSCPPSLRQVPVGQSCAPANLHCDYPDRRCECAQNAPVPGWAAKWKCQSPQQSDDPLTVTDMRCPTPRPRLGTLCYAPGISCDYGVCKIHGGNQQGCVPFDEGAKALDRGRWVDEPVDCSCPTTVPVANTRCTRQWVTCEYGSSHIQDCDTIATCLAQSASQPNATTWDGTWSVHVPDGGPPCAAKPASECPAPGQPIQGTPCNSPSLDCDYADKRCECANGPAPQSATTWRCTDPLLAGPGCGVRPRLGAACPQDGLSCNYGACEIAGGNVEYCQGVWRIASATCQLPACPPSPPARGSLCLGPGLCEYGTSNVAVCDTVALCWYGAWQLSDPDAGGASCQPPPPSGCPASFDTVPRGASCAGAPSFCDYPQGRCQCAAAPGSSGSTWSCQDPTPPCPQPRPRLGSLCTQEGLVCAYDSCLNANGETQICQIGEWAPLALGCSSDAGPAFGPIDAGAQ